MIFSQNIKIARLTVVHVISAVRQTNVAFAIVDRRTYLGLC